MAKVRVKKLSDNKNTYNTHIDELDEMPLPPEVGHCLLLTSSSSPNSGIWTSLVKGIEETGTTIKVTTRNSVYEIDVLEEA